jgi:predicted tellurium resistance membrane protein TerC
MHLAVMLLQFLKGYLYFAISFSFLVEVLNMKAKKKKKLKKAPGAFLLE